MRLGNFFIVVFCLFCAQVFGQKILLIDQETALPIEGVIMSSSEVNLRATSNFDGEIDFDLFSPHGSYDFYHPNYQLTTYSLKKLKRNSYVVKLERITEDLGEIVLSVSKKAEKRTQLAEQIEVISAKEIRTLAPQTSADMLASTPGVRVQKSQFGGGSPVLRGMEANRVLLVIDGVRMNNAIYRKGHLQNSITVSPLSLERTEVLFGPSSVQYGSDALGGVIHFYTKKPGFAESGELNLDYYTRFSSVNKEFTNQLAAEFGFQNVASYTSISYSTFGDLKMGKNRSHGYESWGLVPEYSNNSRDFYSPNPISNPNPEEQKNTGFNQLDLIQKFVINLGPSHELILNGQYSSSSDIPRFDKLTETTGSGDLKFAEWYYGPQERLLASVNLTSDMQNFLADENTTIFAYQNIKEQRIQRKFGSLDRSYRDEVVNVYSLNSDFSKDLSERLALHYGFEFVFNTVNSSAIGEVLEVSGNDIIGFTDTFAVQSRYPDGGSSYNSQAAYVDFKWNSSDKSVFNLGLRYTTTQLEALWIDQTFVEVPQTAIELNNGALTANLNYVYNANELWQFRTLVSSGFRSPNIDDIGKIREKNGFVSVPNINLRPEYAYNGELGFSRYLNKRQFRLDFTAYYTLLDKYIMRGVYDITGSVVTLENPPTILYDDEEAITYANINKGTAYIYGMSLGFQGKINKNWTTKANLTYTEGASYDDKTPLSSIPPLFGFANLNYQKNKFGLGFNVDFNAAKRPEDYNIEEGIDNLEQSPTDDKSPYGFAGTPAWYTLNFNSNYNLSHYATLQFMVQNITDQHYKEFASAISAPGRNFVLSVNFSI